MQTLSPGTLLHNNTYRIELVLGQGGFGITYLATDLNLQRKVAIKEFFPKDFCDRDETTSHVTLGTKNTSEFVNRLKAKFLKEARNIAKFDHPNIIRIYAAFEENNTAYYVMDYIEGESLSSLVKKNGPLPAMQALDYIEKIGKALDYVHSRKINHLDIKPANIMLRSEDKTPILIDFGLSKQYDSEGNQTSTMPPGFSHGFAPMEQYNDGGVKGFSPQTDIYALGATLYYLLSGVVPIQATRRNDEDLTFPATIPPEWVSAIAKAMSPGRKLRHSEVKEFIRDLRSDDLPTEVTEVITPYYEPKPRPQPITQPHPQPITQPVKTSNGKIYLLVAVVIAIVSGALWFLLKDPQPQYDTPDLTVTNMEWVSPLGGSVYSGEIKMDTLSNGEIKKIPHGRGVVKINKGNFAGSIYDGSLVDGRMEGSATYTLSNGDIFTGTFHLNEFEDGKYLDKESGEYFEGRFRDKQPYKGKWYSATGAVVDELK